MLEAPYYLEMAGQATDGRDAVELCRRLRPDLVPMDIAMPVMDGVEAVAIRSVRRPEHCPRCCPNLRRPNLRGPSLEDLRKARRIAHAFRFICPSYYIPGEQDWGAF